MGRHVRDLTGQRFGRLVVLRMHDKRQNNLVVWECQCDCGSIINVTGGNLTSGNTSSCGCLRNQTHIIDCAGQRYGRLVAIRPLEERKRGYIVWECNCDCGNNTHVISSHLKNGNTCSCGCLQKDFITNIRRHHLVGTRFGKLTVLSRTFDIKSGYIIWKCQCDCGNTINLSTYELKYGKHTSCGCTNKG